MGLALFASYINQGGRIQGGFEDTEVVQPSTFGKKTVMESPVKWVFSPTITITINDPLLQQI